MIWAITEFLKTDHEGLEPFTTEKLYNRSFGLYLESPQPQTTTVFRNDTESLLVSHKRVS